MNNFHINAKVIENVAREAMLSGHFEDAQKVLKESLIGINQEQINDILNGVSEIINVENGINIIKNSNVEYQKNLLAVKEKMENSEFEQRKIKHEKLKKFYLKKHYEYVNHKTENGIISAPKIIIDELIGKISSSNLFNEVSAFEQIKILLPFCTEKEIQDVISDIKFFGYQIFSNFTLYKENNSFGRLNGIVKKLEDKSNIKDTDILFLDIEDRESLLKHYRLFEKAGAVIAYSTMTSLLAHVDIFRNSKEDFEQTPLLLINRNQKEEINKMYKKNITINFKLNTISAKWYF